MKPGGDSPAPPAVLVWAFDPESRRSLHGVLVKAGLLARTQEVADEAPPDVVLLDLRELRGPAVAETIARCRAACDEAEVVGLCRQEEAAGEEAEASGLLAMRGGAHGCVYTPVGAAALAVACEQAARGTRLLRENRRLGAELSRLKAGTGAREREWERTLDTIPDAIALCDGQGRVKQANQALADFLGCAREDMRRRPIEELLLPLLLRVRVDEALAQGGVAVCESPPGQGRTYMATISSLGPSGEPDGTEAVVLLRDVTDERRLQRRLVLGERMAAVGQLAAGLAHEINNPVSFAYSNLQMAKELLQRHQEALPAPLLELSEMLEDCRVGIGRVGDIVRDLRTFTSTEVRGAAGEVRLDDIIDLGLRLTRSEVQRRARLVYDRDLVPTPLIRGDAGKLSHVLMNLLSQALHNLPAADDAEAGSQVITVRTRVDRRRGIVELVVADTGPTLSDEMRSHLFEPFAQRRVRLPAAVSAALGMGLAVSYEVVHRHGGEIEARPGSGKQPDHGGNELIVRLPISRRGVDSGGGALVAGALNRRRVLLVDDEPFLLRSYHRLLSDLHEVVTVSSGREALTLLRAGETFDVIFCDLEMPQMDGASLYREVAAQDASLAGRFVFLGSGPARAEARAFLDEVGRPCIEKPARREALLQSIEASLAAPES